MKRLVVVGRGIHTAVGVCAALALSLASGACSERPTTPLGPVIEPGSPAPPQPTLVVSGTVFASGQPVADAIAEVRTSTTVRIVRTNSGGHYTTVLNNDSPTSVSVTAFHKQFPFQPCATWFELNEGGNQERSIDVTLTSTRGPSGVPAASVPGRKKVAGTVVTMTSAGRKPVPSATVVWDASSDEWKAWTETDTAGRFALCGLPVDRSFSITVHKDSLGAWGTVQPATGDANIEIVLE